MYFNRFDIAGAYYFYFRDYHGGQKSIEYKRLTKIKSYLKCNPFWDICDLNENAKAIYDNLVKRGEK